MASAKKKKKKVVAKPARPRRYRSYALERRIREVGGVEVMLERLSDILPKLPPSEPPRVELTADQRRYLEAALIRDMTTEKPVITSWNQWLKAKAQYYTVDLFRVEEIMEKHFGRLAKQAKTYDYQSTQAVATALGLDRVKLVNKLTELLEAKKPIAKWVYDGPEDKVGHEHIIFVPDNKTRSDATKMLLGLYGKEPPSQHVHELEKTDATDTMTVAEMAAKFKQLRIDAERLGVGSLEGQVIEGRITEQV